MNKNLSALNGEGKSDETIGAAIELTAKQNTAKPHKKLRQKSTSERIFFGAVFVIFLIYAVALLIPFFYGFSIALKKNGRAFMRDPVKITAPFYFSNFAKAFDAIKINESNTFVTMIINSIWFSVGSSVIGVFCSTCIAYVVAKYDFKGRKFIYGLTIVLMMIPIYGALPARYRLYSKLGLLNTPLYLITQLGGFNANFIYIHAFFKSFSWSYAEAAFIDGAGNAKVFFTIALPMLLPSISALLIMTFIGCWNDYMTPLLFLPNMLPLATGLYTYEFNMQYEANQPLYFAGVFLSLVPVLTLFVCFQDTIMSKVYSGGIKG